MTTTSVSDAGALSIAFIGFGEAGSTIAGAVANTAGIRAYDIKTDHADRAVRDGKWSDYDRAGITGCRSVGEALSRASLVFSTVTADQAATAAQSALKHLSAGELYLDCNSCAPDTKRAAAALIEAAGARYVDAAVMAPVRPGMKETPFLLSGPHADVAATVLKGLGLSASVMEGPVGASSSVKMIRSVVMKGLEALVLECVLAGRKAGVDEAVLDSLDASYPGFDWKGRSAYLMERAMTHGLRRAAEMRESAVTVSDLGLGGKMAAATADWEQRIGDLGLDAGAIGEADYRRLADAILAAMNETPDRETASMTEQKPYDDIPGTYVFDAERSRKGYHLNMFCMSLRHADNRAAFLANEEAYLDRFPMTAEQRAAVLRRDWNGMLSLGGNIYYTSKLGAADGLSFQDLAGQMTGMTRDAYRKMMVDGGRPIEGNRSKREWADG